jgi:hypothetical protein
MIPGPVDAASLGHHHPVSSHEGLTIMTNPEAGQQDEGGFGCWWMIVIAIIVIFAVLVGYIVLV